MCSHQSIINKLPVLILALSCAISLIVVSEKVKSLHFSLQRKVLINFFE